MSGNQSGGRFIASSFSAQQARLLVALASIPDKQLHA